jgi:translation initiation factor IF-3
MAFQPQNRINVNGRIRAREVRVIMASTKEQLGIMRTSDALRRANSMGLDLVEIAPTANPPVCQIVDFGKYRYELAKQEKERKHSVARLKEVKFRVNIDEHDYTTKLRRAEEFLDKGSKVKVQLQFRGREMAHKELGDQLMQKVKGDLSGMSAVEMEPKHAGRSINMTLSPLPANRRKRRFTPMTEAESDAADAAEAAEAADHEDHEHEHDEHHEHPPAA